MIRRATLDDVAAIAELERVLFGIDAWTEQQVADELTGPGRAAWVAEVATSSHAPADWSQTAAAGLVSLRIGPKPQPHDLIGYAVTSTTTDVVDLHRIGVHPDHQRHGVARELLGTATESTLREAPSGARMLLEVGETNQAARAFYARAGFVEIARRRRYYRDGSDALVLERVHDQQHEQP